MILRYTLPLVTQYALQAYLPQEWIICLCCGGQVRIVSTLDVELLDERRSIFYVFRFVISNKENMLFCYSWHAKVGWNSELLNCVI